jgi:hypothetical protein
VSDTLLPGMPTAAKDQPAVPVPTIRDAVISTDGAHRYRLFRRWGSGPVCTWVCLNPSVADGGKDDPTCRRIMSFSRSFGCGAAMVLNLYAYRATEPSDLWRAADPIGEFNDEHLSEAAVYAADCDTPLIAAWGALARPERIAAVLALPGMERFTALAVTKSGQPRHPLYLAGSLRPEPWSQP